MANYTLITLGELKARLSERVGNNVVFWGDTEKGDAINEAICVWQCLVGEWTDKFPIGITSGATWYAVPRQIVSVQRMLYGLTPLTLGSLPEMDYGQVGWENDASGTPQIWMPSGLTEVAIWPPATTGTLTFEGITDAPRLISDGDLLQVGEEEVTPLLAYAHHYLSLKEGGAEFNSTLPNLVEFIEAASLRNSRLVPTALYRTLMGQHRDEGGRPPRGEDQKVGARL